MDIQTIANRLKELGIEEIKKLAAILEDDVETALGLHIDGKPIIASIQPSSVSPTCDPGYYWDAETARCILNVG